MELEKAIQIATEAHRRQSDKAGKPYILHPIRVMLGADSDDERVVAVLHDVIEDSAWTIDELRAEGLSEAQAAALDALTRREGETYSDFIDRAALDTVGRAVKILDLHDNCDLSRIPHPSGTDIRRVEKYRAALAKLGAAAPDQDEVRKALTGATHALRSYQYGNASTELAQAVADHCEELLARMKRPQAQGC